ncbi:MAG: ABC transporter permease [Bryobacterales bacterium]
MVQALSAVFFREYRIRTTNLVWLFFDLMLPLMYLLVFGLGFTRALGEEFVVNGRTVEYNEFFLGGVLAMASFGVAMNTTWSWFMDRDTGMFYETLTYPMTRQQHLLGKGLFNVLLGIVEGALVVGGAALFLGMEPLWARLPLLALAMTVGTAGWFFFFSTLALRIRRNDMFQTVINALYFVLLFASNMFYPLEPLPSWLRVTAVANPITWQVDIFRYATVDLAEGNLWWQSLFFLGFTIASFAGAAYVLRHQE